MNAHLCRQIYKSNWSSLLLSQRPDCQLYGLLQYSRGSVTSLPSQNVRYAGKSRLSFRTSKVLTVKLCHRPHHKGQRHTYRFTGTDCPIGNDAIHIITGDVSHHQFNTIRCFLEKGLNLNVCLIFFINPILRGTSL